MNKNLKNSMLAVVAVLGLVANSFAISPTSVPTRRDQKGEGANPLYGGYSHMRNSATSEMVVCSGRCLLAAVVLGTGPTTSTLTIRNSSVADGSGAIVIRPRFEVANSGYGQNPNPPLPILLDKGITATLSSISAGEEVTVEYLDLD
jgi:hypothetical protein